MTRGSRIGGAARSLSRMSALESLRDRVAELADLSAVEMACRLGSARDDAADGARRALPRARHAAAPYPRTRDRRGARRVAGRARRRGAGRARPRHRAHRAARLGAPAASPRARGRDRERGGRGPGELAGGARRRRLSAFAPALRATSSSPASTGACVERRGPLRGPARRLRLRPAGERVHASSTRSPRRCRRSSARPRAAPAPLAVPVRPAGGRRGHLRGSASRRPAGASMSRRIRSRLDRPRRHRVTTRYRRRASSRCWLAARVRPRPLRAPDRPGAGAHEPRARHLDVGARVPEQAVGEPRRAQPPRSPGCWPASSAPPASGSTPGSCTRRSSACALADPRRADPLTYPLHIILRFELELALIEGELAVADLPAAWREGMQRLLGVEVPSDALGCCRTSTGQRALRLLPQLRARLPDRRAAVGGVVAELGLARRTCAAARSRRSGSGWPSTCTATAAAWTPFPSSSRPPGRARGRAVPALRQRGGLMSGLSGCIRLPAIG